MILIGTLVADPAAWAALLALFVMEVVLGIDNLVLISVLANKLPEAYRQRAFHLGIGLALVMRLLLLSTLAWLVGMVTPIFDLGIAGSRTNGELAFETQFSLRDLILIGGGLFLVWKATKELHNFADPEPEAAPSPAMKATFGFGAVIVQIVLLDIVFSIDSILTAVAMTNHLSIMITSVIGGVAVMLIAADPLANFIARNPTVVLLGLGFLLLIGAVLIADGFGMHVPRGYIYIAMAFSAGVEVLHIVGRSRRRRLATSVAH